MPETNKPPGSRFLTRLSFALALRAWPRRLRDRHRRSLWQSFDADWRAAAAAPLGRRGWTRARLVADAIAAGAGARLAGARPRSGLRHEDAFMRTIGTDIRHALRALRARPLFTTAVVLTMALGLGAATAIFAVVDAVLLRPLPYPADHELVVIGERDASRNLTGASMPAIEQWRGFPEVGALGAFEASPLLFTHGGNPERVFGAAVSPEFFATLGVDAALGVAFQPGQPTFDPSPRIVLGHDLWRDRFGSDPAALGRSIELEGTTYTIVGVMPELFAMPAGAGFWRTFPPSMALIGDMPTLHFLEVVARLAPGAAVEDLATRLAAWKSAQPADDDAGWRVFATTLRHEMRGGVGPAIVTVFVGVGLLLLVTCANVMALLLASGRARRDELAVRTALGASRARLVRQVLAEGICLALAGSALALVATRATRALVIDLSADQIPRIDGLGVSPAVVTFAIGAGLFAALLVTLWPAWSLTRSTTGPRSTRSVFGSRRSRRVFGGLVAAEFALALVLVAGAGLLASSYRHLTAVETGTSPDRVGIARVVLPLGPEWRGDDTRRRLFEDLGARLRALPGIEQAAFVSRLPLDAARGGSDVSAAGRPAPAVRAMHLMASPGYFDTVGARLLAGRGFDETDREGAPSVVVLNALAAIALFGSPDAAIGEAVEYEYFTGPVSAGVIGVVEPIRYGDLSAELRAELYTPSGQGTVLPLSLVYRASGEPESLVPSIRAALADVDRTSTVALDEVSTLDARLSRVVARPRFFLVLVSVFAALSFALAACGIYGTTAYWLAESRREIGLRLALGATPRRLIRAMTARGAALAAIGILAGLGLAIAVNRYLAHLLFGVEPTDPLTLAAAAALLALGGAVACWLPSRRVSAIDPAETLRGLG